MTTWINHNDIEKKERARGVTLEQTFADYLLARKSLKATTIYDDKRCFEAYLPDWNKKSFFRNQQGYGDCLKRGVVLANMLR